MRGMLAFLFTSLLIVRVGYAQVGFTQEGVASFYGDEFEGRVTASGERYSHNKATCAHLSIPFGSLVKITNLDNGQTAIVRVNDRGPFVPDRVVDVSRSVAERLGMIPTGVARVKVEVVDANAPLPANQNAIEEVPAKPKVGTVKVAGSSSTSKTSTAQGEGEFYQLKVTPVKPARYGIQIGSYKEPVNVFKIASDFQKLLKQSMMINVVNVNGEKVYRLLVGGFETRKEAEEVKNKIQNDYPGCFVVGF
ncbi:MAG TPA: septal ring lytic transglycosylase RlpA family protein [Tenuifilaceae bacterium]|nr:septal ring lytic transglycosylase RlpA family protein [Tenuifilaceae bacterium]HQM04969.1 septal ring lytic transglycosylase RlpA family protein [Tenuifilaceae bacterium]